MTRWQGRAKRKPSGGRYIAFRKKRKSESGSDPIFARIGEMQKKKIRTTGGNSKTQIILADYANLMVSQGKFKKSKIRTVKENPSNRHFVRMNVMTRGAIIETEDGLARVTSKPTKDGIVNAVLIKGK